MFDLIERKFARFDAEGLLERGSAGDVAFG